MTEIEKKIANYEKLLRSEPKSTFTQFFQKDKTLVFIQLSIINPKTNDKFTVVRNKKCFKTTCLYDPKEVFHRLEISKYFFDYDFECKMCGNVIKLRDFRLEESLNKKIEEFWKTYNAKEIEFNAVNVFKDGRIEPILKPKEKAPASEESEEEVKVVQIKPPIKKKRIKVQSTEDPNVVIPAFEDFSSEEFEEYIEGIRSKTKEFFSAFGNGISYKEIRGLIDDEIMSESLMAFFLKALEKRDSTKNPKKRAYFAAFSVEYFEKKGVSLELTTDFLPGFEFSVTEEEFLDKYRLIALAVKHQERWIGYVVQREEGHFFATIVDFLDPDLSMENTTDFIDILKKFLKENKAEFIKIVNFEFYGRGKVGKYVDFGVYVLAYFWKMIEKFSGGGNVKLSVAKEKDFVKELIVWLVFKTWELSQKK